MRRFAAAILLLLASSRSLQSQPPRSTLMLRGRVVAAANGDPIRTARVSIGGAATSAVLTDQEGRFALGPLRRAEYALEVTKAGYAKTSYAVADPTEPQVVRLQRAAVIAGTVVDETGEPVSGVTVMLGPSPAGNQPVQTKAVATTDDVGQYRLAGLEAGNFVVNVFAAAANIRAAPGGVLQFSGPGEPDRRIYYPGVASAAQAQVIAVRPGDERAGIDFTVEARIPGGAAPSEGRAAKTDAVIEGSVVRADGRKLAGAIVRMTPADDTPAPQRITFTGRTGDFRFVLPALASGAYRLAVSRFGYLPKVLDAEVVATGWRITDGIVVPLTRAGTIAGRLFDEYGDPVEGVVVRAMQVRYRDGRRQLIAAMAARSDDLGRYRLGSLQPGRYVISASVGQVDIMEGASDFPGYGTTYFPGTPDTATAQFVQLRGGDDTVDASFALARMTVVKVSGQGLDAAGEPITGGLSLIPSRRGGGIVSAPMGARIGRDGSFEFPAVAPGDYVLHASRHRTSSSDEGESFAQFVTVADDVTGLVVRTAAGSVASGAVVFEGSNTGVPGQVEVSAIPLDPDLSPAIGGPAAHATVGDDLRFTLSGLRGPRRIALTRTPQGWTLKSVTLNGIDVTDAPIHFGRADQSISGLELTLSSRPTTIVGSVTAAGHSRAGAVVLIAGVDRSLWYPHSRYFARASSGRDGTFTVVGLPPGDYFALAITAVPGLTDGDDWQDPEYLDAHTARATRITLAEGAQVSVALVVDR